MLLGEKIKFARKKQGLTQEELAGEQITRNMLSKIEHNVAKPSLETLNYLAEKLNLSISYLCSVDDDLFFYEKKNAIDEIYRSYNAKKYLSCIQRARKLSNIDSEIAYILTESYFKEGLICVKRGSLESAAEYFNNSLKYAEKTVLDTTHITSRIPMYKAICSNINAPLLELEPNIVSDNLLNVVEYDFFKYISADTEYNYQNPAYRTHIKAKRAIKSRDYQGAVSLLLDALQITKDSGYDAYTIFGIYSDLETCYKQLVDFEKAYLYASKKLSLLEGFKS